MCIKKDITPKPVYYSRINCPGYGNAIFPGIVGLNGRPKPLPVYDYTRDGRVILCIPNYELISQWYPHGLQTKKYPPTRIRSSDGRLVAKEGHEHENWGSTLEGGPQVLRGLGDFSHHPHGSTTPFVYCQEINEEGSLLLATDGLTDVLDYKQAMDFIRNNQLKPEFPETFLQFLKDDAATTPINSLGPASDPAFDFTDANLPTWDDVSGIMVSLPKFKKSLSPETLESVKKIIDTMFAI